jgi:hypothetical protein
VTKLIYSAITSLDGYVEDVRTNVKPSLTAHETVGAAPRRRG